MSNTETKDYMVRATAADAQIRAFAVTSKELVENARQAHNTRALATAALGRLLSATVMMGDMLKNEKDLITVRIDGDGPLKSVLATADNKGNVKGYVGNPDVVLPHNSNDHLDVGGGVGTGTLTVIRDTGLKDPYVGTVSLYTGEVAEDITYYFAESEQTPSSVGLGVLVDAQEHVMAAGGFIIQLMPGASEENISKLEESLRKITSVTDILRAGHTPEQMLLMALDGFDVEFTGKMPVRFHCNCDRDRVERALMLIGTKEIDDMIADGKEVELGCQFCGKKYKFTLDDLEAVKIKAKASKASRNDVLA